MSIRRILVDLSIAKHQRWKTTGERGHLMDFLTAQQLRAVFDDGFQPISRSRDGRVTLREDGAAGPVGLAN